MGRLTTIVNRLYSDYLMPSRLDEYATILQTLNDNGYKSISIREYNKLLSSDGLEGRYFVNRHDIDTDVATAKEFFKIEKKYKAHASYYFRLSTLDFKFMKDIESYGSEASYHFEEIATFAKSKHIKSKEEVLYNLDEIKNIFKANFLMIEKGLGTKLYTVCSHGDFANRALKLINNEITKDDALREELKIDCEAYDEDIVHGFDAYVSDAPYPAYYNPRPIFDFIGEEEIICMLSHPRQWRTNWAINTMDNIKRVYGGIRW